MNQERKVSVLRNLLERVQKRAGAPRVATISVPLDGPATASVPAATSVAAAPPMAISAPPAQPPKTSARPGSSTLPLDFGSRGEAASFRPAPDPVSEPPFAEVQRGSAGARSDGGPAPQPEGEAEQGPPSAPRLREMPEVDVATEEREIDEEEPQLKTPPPESGRQHVTPGPTVTVGEVEEDISVTVSMEESELPPAVSPPRSEVASAPMSASSRHELPEVSGPQPRLALVSEPEIELHGMTPLAAISEPVRPFAPVKPSVPSAIPSGVRQVPPPAAGPPPAPPAPPPAPAAPYARTAPSVPDTKPSVSATAPPESAAAPPVRLMAQPLGDASGKPLPPVEVWASTFIPAALRGQVASFVGQNANFESKTFGELVRASIALGEEKP